jgi:Leucine-rich repeat (LRR) protein
VKKSFVDSRSPPSRAPARDSELLCVMPKLSHSGQKPAQGKPYARRRDEQQPPAAGSFADCKPYPPRPRKPGQSDQPNRHVKVDGGAQGTKPQRASQQLDLSGQQLTQLPRLADYAALSKLNLSNCGLTDITFVKDAAPSLTWLNVTGNDLSRDGAWNGVESLSTLFGACPPVYRVLFAKLTRPSRAQS